MNKPQLSSPRRPRCPARAPSPAGVAQPAYAVAPPVLLAVATLSLAALRRILASDNPPLAVLLRALRRNLRALLPARPRAPPVALKALDARTRLDALRDRSIAEIDALQPSPADYASLAPLQRRALLQSAIERAYHSPRPVPPVRRDVVQQLAEEPVVERVQDGVGKRFWNAAELLNGRAAALGFVLCLAREVAEPGHPSLFEQVVDVVVPIAQKTPPFLVAVVDRLVDLVT